jgi:hypothetical protein
MPGIRTLLFIMLALPLAACGWLQGAGISQNIPPADRFTVGEEVAVSGLMIGARDDCVVDGNCSIILEADGAAVEAIWNEGFTGRPCLGAVQDALNLGDPVEAYGLAVSSNALSICPSEMYFIRETILTPVEPG